MLCPLYQHPCADDCAWLILDRHAGGKACVVVILARELIKVSLDAKQPREQKV